MLTIIRRRHPRGCRRLRCVVAAVGRQRPRAMLATMFAMLATFCVLACMASMWRAWRTWQPPQVDGVLAEAVALAGHASLHAGPVQGALGDPHRPGRSLDLFRGHLPASVFKEIPQPLGGLVPFGPLLGVLAHTAEQVPYRALGLPAG